MSSVLDIFHVSNVSIVYLRKKETVARNSIMQETIGDIFILQEFLQLQEDLHP